MDQKCTPDVISFSAESILNLSQNHQDFGFTTRTIWDSTFFANNVEREFSKPDVNEKTARSEIDKFIAQPLKTLAFAGILESKLNGKRIEFRVSDRLLLEQIALGPRQARAFLVPYLEVTLKQSGIYYHFENYFDGDQTEEDFIQLRDRFNRFMLDHTFINSTTEVQRIFPKVLNPLAHNLGIKGAIKGRVSPEPIMTSQLLYNQENFRDLGKKSKRETRQQAQAALSDTQVKSDRSMSRVMNAIRIRHQEISELQDAWSNGTATQVHHIFPQSQQPLLRAIPENLILLTPTQHNTRAHPRNNTRSIDFDYQIDCLLAKLNSVRTSVERGDDFYKLERLVGVIKIGYPDINLSSKPSFDELALVLRAYQNFGSN